MRLSTLSERTQSFLPPGDRGKAGADVAHNPVLTAHSFRNSLIFNSEQKHLVCLLCGAISDLMVYAICRGDLAQTVCYQSG